MKNFPRKPIVCRIRKTVENCPKYSRPYGGARAIFEQFPRAGYRRKKKRGETRDREREREREREKWAILVGLPVISRFYSGRLARLVLVETVVLLAYSPAHRASSSSVAFGKGPFEWVHTRKPRDRTSR